MKIFSFDAETNGLWGEPFAIAAILYEDGAEKIFIGRCPIEGEVDDFVRENVLPEIKFIKEDCSSYDELLSEFAKFYLANKDGADVIAHMAVPVESGLLLDMHERGLIGDWEGPYPLIDLAGCLKAVGEDPTSVDGYAKKYGISVDPAEFEGGTHNPLYDSAQAAVVYRHLLG